MVLVGYIRSSGISEKYGPYDNWNLHCLDDDESFVGQRCVIHKVPVNMLASPPALGSDIDVIYDRYGNIRKII